MPTPSTSLDDAGRLEELRALQLPGSPSEPVFDNLTELASEICDAPVALISFVDQDRIWFKSRVGFDDPHGPREHSFCSHAVEGTDPLVVEDATADPRFQENVYVRAAHGIRFYAGIPLVLSSGHAVGTLCVIDHKARTLSDKQLGSLKRLALQVTALIEAKHTALLLKESEFRWRFAIEGSGDGLWDWDIQNNHVFYSERWLALLGLENDAAGHDPQVWSSHLHPQDKDRVLAQVQPHLDAQTPHYANEHRVICKDGSTKWMLGRGLVVQRDAEGRPLRMIGTNSDVSARNQTVETLRHTQALLANAEKLGRVGGWEIDVQTLQTTWTEGVYDIYELDGNDRLTVDEGVNYYTLESRQIIAQAVQRAIDQDEPFDLELEIISAKGNRRSVHAVGKPDRARGKVSGFFQDITERKHNEAAIQEMNRNLTESRQQLRNLVALNETKLEKEKRHIAREVHDELGQTLTALRMELSLAIVRHADHTPDLLEALHGMKMQVDRAIQGVRNVATTLRPAVLDMGLTTALEWLCQEFSKKGDVKCVRHGFDEGFEIDDSRAVVIFRIVQEALNNIQKYAQAGQVEITLTRREAELSVEVRDNGLGFEMAAAAQRGTLGLLGMRERAHALGGRLEAVSTPRQGTVIELVIPLETEVAKAPA